MLHEFDYLAPDTREDLLKILAQYQTSAAILAGGTDILTNIRLDIAAPRTLVTPSGPGAREHHPNCF